LAGNLSTVVSILHVKHVYMIENKGIERKKCTATILCIINDCASSSRPPIVRLVEPGPKNRLNKRLRKPATEENSIGDFAPPVDDSNHLNLKFGGNLAGSSLVQFHEKIRWPEDR